MAKYLAVAKAARLIGVKRAILQKLIRDGDLHTFEGMVDMDELEQQFPAVQWETSPMVERAKILRDNAYGRRLQSTFFNEQDSLEIQLKRLQVELALHKSKESSYRQILVELMERLGQLQQRDSHRQIAGELNAWLLEKFKKDQA